MESFDKHARPDIICMQTNFSFAAASRNEDLVRYAKPQSLEEALALLGDGPWRILSGGTDFYPALAGRPIDFDVLDISGIKALRGIAQAASHTVIGALTTWTDIVRASLPPAFDALREAAREVGSVQIQNTGTIAGNLCNASPAADGVPPLLMLDAKVDIASAGGSRTLPLQDFILGNRKTALAPGEMVTAIRIPEAASTGASAFCKLGARRYLVISIAMAAARLELDQGGRIAAAAIAVGSCSAVAQRLAGLESALLRRETGELAPIIEAYGFAELTPIDDVRGSADYRRSAAREIVARAVARAARSDQPTRDAA